MTYRNRKLLALAKDSPKCFCCNVDNDGTVVAAHGNLQALGKGLGHKASDWAIAFMCSGCHSSYDRRSGSPHQVTHEDWALAAVRSIGWALETHPEVFQ